MFDRFVVAADGSDTARAAARISFDLAAAFDAPVDLLNVLERSLLDALRSDTDREKLRGERVDFLEDLAAEARERDLRATTTVLDGNPAARIADYADSRPGAVVVLGRQGRSSVSRQLLGGVTEGVIGAGTAPVLVVPGPRESAPSNGGPVLVPTDGSENARNAYPHAATLAAELDASIHLLSVLDVQRVGGVFDAGGLDRSVIDRFEADLRETLEAGRATLTERGPWTTIDTELRRTDEFEGISGQIRSAAQSVDAGWIVMGSHGRTNVKRQLVGSVTETLLRDVDVPVVVVPRGLAQSSAG